MSSAFSGAWFHVFGALAQFERSLTRERVKAGPAAALRRGRRGGRPAAIGAEKLTAIVLAFEGGATKAAVCRTFGVKRGTLVDSLARIGWSRGLDVQGGGRDAAATIDGTSARGAVRSAHGST